MDKFARRSNRSAGSSEIVAATAVSSSCQLVAATVVSSSCQLVAATAVSSSRLVSTADQRTTQLAPQAGRSVPMMTQVPLNLTTAPRRSEPNMITIKGQPSVHMPPAEDLPLNLTKVVKQSGYLPERIMPVVVQRSTQIHNPSSTQKVQPTHGSLRVRSDAALRAHSGERVSIARDEVVCLDILDEREVAERLEHVVNLLNLQPGQPHADSQPNGYVDWWVTVAMAVIYWFKST